MPKGKAQDKLREIKRNHIFNLIANNKDLSKLDIKRLCGYSMTSVISIIDELTNADLITAVDSGISSGGRPPVMININKDGGHIIGIDWSRQSICCAIYNLSRERIYYIKETTENIITIKAFLDRLIVVITNAIKAVSGIIRSFKLLGIGIGVPGYIDDNKGTVSRYIYIDDYKDVPVKDILTKHFKVPVFLENNVNAMALGYKWLRKEGNAKSLLVIAVRRGVKAGIILNNQLIKGANDSAGEIGNLKAFPEGEITSKSGNTYEEILSDYTVINNTKSIKAANEIIGLAEKGDKFSILYLNELADVMAKLLNYAIALINPETILLSGGYAGSEYFLNLIRKRVNGNILGGSGEELGTIGASGLVIEKLFSY